MRLDAIETTVVAGEKLAAPIASELGEQVARAFSGGARSEHVLPELTEANNPAILMRSAFERFHAAVNPMSKPDWQDTIRFQEDHNAIDEAKMSLARTLTTLWHGTETQPGMRYFSDKQLSNSQIPESAVRQIRAAALSDDARLKLLGVERTDIKLGGKPYEELTAEEHDYVSLKSRYRLGSSQFEPLKEEFFNYSGLEVRMQPPTGVFNFHSRALTEPKAWFPHSETPMWANLFHGTTSSALPNIAKQEAVLSVRELDTRGIEKTTGESSGHLAQTPGDVSMWKYFSRALTWASSQTSRNVDEFPVVIGMSGSVANRGRWGTLGGEIAVSKQVLMNGIEGTHVYVPDRKVAETRRLFGPSAQRLQIIGFNQLQAPPWDLRAMTRDDVLTLNSPPHNSTGPSRRRFAQPIEPKWTELATLPPWLHRRRPNPIHTY